jgi:uncharacterized protein (TIGR03437 family)
MKGSKKAMRISRTTFAAKARGLALLSLVLGAASLCGATNITYDVNLKIGAGGVTGYIVTDGTLGVLAEADIIGYNLLLSDPAASPHTTWNLSCCNFFGFDGSDLSATATQLLFNFSGTDIGFVNFADPSLDFELFFSTPRGSNEGAGETIAFETTSPKVGYNYQFTSLSGTQVIGSAHVPSPSVNSGGVVSASAFGQFTSAAPGSWIEIYGTSLAAVTQTWGSSNFNGVNGPTMLGGTSVSIGGLAAFVDYISPLQVNVQVPGGVSIGAQPLILTTAAGASPPLTVTVNATQPGLLAPSSFNIGGTQYVVAQFADGTYVLPPGAISGITSQRAQPGDTIVIYGIGFGSVTPNIPPGQLVEQLNTLAEPFTISFGGTQATTIAYDGLAPNYMGLYQFNVVVPTVAASDTVPLTFSVGGVSGTQTLAIAIGN